MLRSSKHRASPFSFNVSGQDYTVEAAGSEKKNWEDTWNFLVAGFNFLKTIFLGLISFFWGDYCVKSVLLRPAQDEPWSSSPGSQAAFDGRMKSRKVCASVQLTWLGDVNV